MIRRMLGKPGGVVGLTATLILIAQWWMASGGSFIHWPPSSADYSAEAAGFLHGQLDLRIRPKPKLLALPNPYDPAVDQQYALRDAVLFNGKYYYYWGP